MAKLQNLKRYFQIQTTVSINCTNCQKIDRDDVTSRLIRLCQIDYDLHDDLMNLDRGDGGLMLSTPCRGVQKLVHLKYDYVEFRQ